MTQGTIFSGALAEDYLGCHVCGIVITARCDLSHDKVSRYTYLPMVKTVDWLQRDGLELAVERSTKELLNTFGNYIRSAGFSDKLLETESPSRILSVLFPDNSTNNNIKKIRPKISDIVDRLIRLKSLSEADCPDKRLRLMQECNPRIMNAILKDLVIGRFAGFYFIEDAINDNSNGHVVLLREVRHIPRVVARRIEDGLELRTLQHDRVLLAVAQNVLNLAEQETLLPVAQLRSPYIEHLMQNFSMLFSRIGVPDIETRQLAELLRMNLTSEAPV